MPDLVKKRKQEEEEKKKQSQAPKPAVVKPAQTNKSASTPKKTSSSVTGAMGASTGGYKVSIHNTLGSNANASNERVMKVDMNTLKTTQHAVNVAKQIGSDDERDAFLKQYQNHQKKTTGSKTRIDELRSQVDKSTKGGVYAETVQKSRAEENQKRAALKAALGALGNLYDADGNAININTASFAEAVQGIRSIANSTARKKAAEQLEALTQMEGSRFFGQTFDKTLTNTYLGNPKFTEAKYKEVTAKYQNAFYPQSGYDEQNNAQYRAFFDAIQNSSQYDANARRQLEEALNVAYRNATGKNAPKYEKPPEVESAVEEAPDESGREKKQDTSNTIVDKIVEAGSAIGGWWNELTDGDRQFIPEEGEEVSSLPGGAVMTGRIASNSVVDVAPDLSAGMVKPGNFNYEAKTGEIDLANDPIKAIVEYTDKGLSDQLTAETKQAINKYVSSSPGISALWGVLSNESLKEFAYLDENGKIVSEKNNRTADNIYRDNYGILGYEMSRYAMKVKDNAFPSALREDAAGVLSNIVEAAEREAALPEMADMYDTDFVNIYDQYLEIHPEAKEALVAAFAYEDEVKQAEREARSLADAESQINEQKALEISQEACKTGLGTPEDWDRVATAAAQVTKEQLYDDEFYFDMRTEIGIARSSSDRDIGNLNDWYNEKTSEWLSANGIKADLTKLPAIQYKDMLQGYVLDALDQVATTAYSLGYKSLAEYNDKTGVLNGDMLYQIASYNMQKEEAAITEEVAVEAERIAYGGTDDSFGMWAQGIAYSAKTGFADQTAAQAYEAIYNFAVSTNLNVDTARTRSTFINRYGYAEAADAYVDIMTQMADGGYFPSEELAKHVKSVLASGGDPFVLGIMPEDMGWAAEGARRNQQQVAEYQAWAQENLTEAQGLAAEVTFTTASNTATQLIAKGLNIVTGGGSAAAQIISSMIAYGGFGGSYNEGFRAALDNGRSLRGANIMGTTESFAVAVANLESDKSFTSNFMGMLGLNSAVEMAIDEIGVPAANRLWRSTLSGLKGVGESLVDEVLKDEIKEGLWKAGLGGGMESLLDATGEMTALPKASDMLRAAGAALGNIDVLGTLTDVIGSAPENAIHMLPMALLSGTTKGVTEWKSYRSLKTAVKTGDPADMKQAAQDIVEDMQDPAKAQAFDEGVSAAQKGKQAAHIMLTDEEISPVLEGAQKANEQHRSHAAKAAASKAAIDTAIQSATAKQENLNNGVYDQSTGDEINAMTEAIAKNKTSLEESTREAAQKKAESDKLYEQAENAAIAKASQKALEKKSQLIQEIAEMAPQIAENARQGELANIEKRIDDINAQIQQEFDKGDDADYELIDSLSAQSGVLAAYLDDAQNPDAGEVNAEAIRTEVEQRLNEIADRKDAFVSAETRAVMEARETTRRLESEQADLKSVFDLMRSDSIYVDETQAANILYETGAKNLSEVNRRFKTKLTKTAGEGTPLDGSYYAELKALAPGYFKEAWDAHPEEAIVSLAQRQKLLKQEILDSKDAEKEANEAYRAKASKRFKAVDEAAATIPPGYALSQFENQNIQSSDVSTEDTNEVVKGTTHKIDTFDSLEKKAVSRIAKSGLKNTVAELMRADRMSNEDIATGREALKMLKKNGDILRHAMLAVKLGKESSKAGKELGAFALFQRNMAGSAASDTLDMAEAYNKRKGKFATRIEDLDGDEQLSLGETQYQPFMDAQVSRSSSDPAMQKLSSDVAERSGLSMYWADMPEGIRGFFDRDRGVIVLNQKIGASQGAYVASIHEYTHFMEQSEKYGEYADAVLKAAYGVDYKKSSAMLMDEGAIRDEYAERGKELTEDLLRKELVAAATEQILLGDEAFMRNLFGGGNGGVAVRILSGMDSFLRKNQAKREGKEAVQRYELIQAARAKMQDAIANSVKWKAEAAKSGDAQHMLVGQTTDGKGIYESNFPKNTPKADKQKRLIQLWQNVWSQKPIELNIKEADGTITPIVANFDPSYDPSNAIQSDLGKVMKNQNGSSGDRTVTLNLADDLYDLARTSEYLESEDEQGKPNPTHKDVKQWHYFFNDIVYRGEQGDIPYTVWLDVKEKTGGDGYVYQLYARKTKKDASATAGNASQNPLAGISQSAGQVGAVQSLGTNATGTSISDTSVTDANTGVKNKSVQNAPQLYLQVERDVQGAQTQLGNQQMISDPDTYDRIGAQMPNAPVEMRTEPYGEQTQIQDPTERDVNEVTRRVLANIDALQQEDVNSNNEWNLPLNQFQRDKIGEYGLYGVKLPGLNYNRATKKQRMLCAILATPQDRVGPNRQTLTQQLKDLNSGKLAVVTEADYNYILSQAAIVEGSATDDAGVPLNREGEQAYGRLRDAQANIQPASRAEKLSAWRYINLLSSPVTTIKNIDGNLLIQEAERVSSLGAAWIDRQISKKTGNRTTSYAKRSEKKAGTEAAIKRGRDAYDDYFVAKTSTSRSRNYNTGGDGRVFQTEAFETARNIINFAMDAPDQMFMEKTIVEEMAILKRIGAKIRDEETGNMRDMTDGEMYEEAYNRASERFYHDDNRMVKIMNEIYNVPAFGTVARVLVPFAKTPSNVALRMFDYSPLGLAKSILYDGLYMMNHGKAFSENGVGANFDQRKFVMGMGRGLTGTALTAVGMMLYGIGAIEFGREEEENKKRRNVLSNLGTPYSMYFNIGDTKHEIAFTMPALVGFVIGAGIAERVKDRESLWNIAVGVVSDQVNQFFDNSYLSSLNEVLSGYEEGSSKFFHTVEKTAESYLSQTFSPSALRAFAKAADPYTRDTTSSNWMRQMLNEIVVQNWPFIRQTLPIKYDLTGDAMTQHKVYQAGGVWENAAMHWIDSLLSPTATYSEKDDPALVELLDLSYATNDTGCLPTQLIDDKEWSLAVTASFAKKLGYVEDKKGTPFDIDLSDDEKREVNREYSSLLFNGSGTTQYMDKDGAYTSVVGLREMLESDDWKNAEDDAERVKMVKAKIEEVKLFIMKKVIEQKKKDGEL